MAAFHGSRGVFYTAVALILFVFQPSDAEITCTKRFEDYYVPQYTNRTVMGDLTACVAQCCADLQCVGFSRKKDVADSVQDNCFLKHKIPLAEVSVNGIYVTYITQYDLPVGCPGPCAAAPKECAVGWYIGKATMNNPCGCTTCLKAIVPTQFPTRAPTNAPPTPQCSVANCTAITIVPTCTVEEKMIAIPKGPDINTPPCCLTYACEKKTHAPTTSPTPPTRMPTFKFFPNPIPMRSWPPGSSPCTALGKNHCGGKAPNGCYCDGFCAATNDCCENYADVCGITNSTAPQHTPPPTVFEAVAGAYQNPVFLPKKTDPSWASCQGMCGKSSMTAAGVKCYCDDSCYTTADCCADKEYRCPHAPTSPPTTPPTSGYIYYPQIQSAGVPLFTNQFVSAAGTSPQDIMATLYQNYLADLQKQQQIQNQQQQLQYSTYTPYFPPAPQQQQQQVQVQYTQQQVYYPPVATSNQFVNPVYKTAPASPPVSQPVTLAPVKKGSCKARCGFWSNDVGVSRCMCDKSCSTKGDCCPDYSSFC